MEFYTKSYVFENHQEAIRHVLNDKRELVKKVNTKESLVFSDYVKVVNDFLALSVQFERTPEQLRNFEHYPRLAKDYAIEILKLLTFDMSKEHQNNFINLYINNFEVEKVIN